jgi:transcriptional regulator with XRE-family HTH domain
MPRARRDLGEHVKRVMKLKGLTQKDVQRLSGGRITDGYVASISIGRACNPSVDKLKALADGLGVDMDELFHVACGLPEDMEDLGKSSYAPDPLMLLETVRKAVVNPHVIQILHEVVALSPDERASLLGFIQRLGSTKGKSRRRSNPIRRKTPDF